MAQVRISRDICRGCRYCILICPKSVIGIGEKANSKGYRFAVVVNPDRCIGCRLCVTCCPEAAIDVISKVINLK
ncbi:MAG: 4Fe-4S dicluster domain-containing protein [bacterium]